MADVQLQVMDVLMSKKHVLDGLTAEVRCAEVWHTIQDQVCSMMMMACPDTRYGRINALPQAA